MSKRGTPRLLDSGLTFGRLTSTSEYEMRTRTDGRKRAYQKFNCECSSSVYLAVHTVKSGNTSSCGCLHSDVVSAQMKTHGLSKTSAYRVALNKARRLQKKATLLGVESVKVTSKELSTLLENNNNSCWICKEELTEVCWDHVQPLSKGGAHVLDNLKPSCRSCNSRKGAQWPFTEEMKNKIADEVRASRTPQGHTILVSDGMEVSA